jgi:CpeT/CpcT family (DUF1001)
MFAPLAARLAAAAAAAAAVAAAVPPAMDNAPSAAASPAVPATTAAPPAADADVIALEGLWAGVRDSSEQVLLSLGREASPWPQTSERRVRTVVTPVGVPWLTNHVLYLEEFLEDEPRAPRRQVLIALEPGATANSVRARLYTFADPGRWVHLGYRVALAATLGRGDVLASSGCDLLLVRSGEQFRGGTVGHDCIDPGSAVPRYLDYQLLIGENLYWYRRRLLRQSDGELQQEVIGFDRYEPDEARLYSCRVAWSASGRRRDLRPLLTLDLYEAGGRGRFATPDGRALELTLHGRDWPFAVDRDALLLLLREQGGRSPLATAWAQLDAQQIALELGWLEVRCGSIAPDSDELTQ